MLGLPATTSMTTLRGSHRHPRSVRAGVRWRRQGDRRRPMRHLDRARWASMNCSPRPFPADASPPSSALGWHGRLPAADHAGGPERDKILLPRLGRTTWTAAAALPSPHVGRATARLQAQLRDRLARADYAAPGDWAGLTVTGPQEATDAYGQSWFRYRGALQVSAGQRLTRRQLKANSVRSW
jgi:hypothetical protein